MKNANLFIVGILLTIAIVSCKEKECVGEKCPLIDGTYCPNNMINVDNNCTCPEGLTEFNESCEEDNNINGYLIDDLDCNCLLKTGFGINENGLINITVISTEGEFRTNMNYFGDVEDFEILLNYPVLKCNSEFPNSYPVFRGIVLEDTLNLTVYWREAGPTWFIPVDTCETIKIPR